MNAKQTELLAKQLIAKHLPDSNWQFIWTNSINSLGVCKYGNKSIGLSKKWVNSLPEEEILDTILHEIAHAIAGYAAGHGYMWQQACLQIGAVPERLAKCDVKRSDIAIPTHRMVDTKGNTIKEYYRQPSASTYAKLSSIYVTNRKEETLGKLRIVETSLLDLL